MQTVLTGNIVTPSGAFSGTLSIEGKYIAGIEKRGETKESLPWILPGFIDIHIHGIGDGNCSDEANIRRMQKFGVSTGLTGFLPTLGVAPVAKLKEIAAAVNTIMSEDQTGSRVLGHHMEGPYVEVSQCGGMIPEMLRIPEESEIDELLAAFNGKLKMVTLAPGVEGADTAIRKLKSAGVVIAAGHTACTPERLRETVELGLDHICHLFDTFPGNKNKGGVMPVNLTDAILVDDRLTVELICDGCHVHQELIELTKRAAGADRIIAITDSHLGAGMPEGIYHSPNGDAYELSKARGCRRLRDNGLIGSCLTMNIAFINLTGRFGFTPEEAAKMTATNAAKKLGISDRTGSLEVGKHADIAVIEPLSGEVDACFIDGREEYRKNA